MQPVGITGEAAFATFGREERTVAVSSSIGDRRHKTYGWLCRPPRKFHSVLFVPLAEDSVRSAGFGAAFKVLDDVEAQFRKHCDFRLSLLRKKPASADSRK